MSEYMFDVRQATEILVRGITAIQNLAIATHSPILSDESYSCDFKGKKFWRIVHHMGNGQDMVECFVEIATGDVFKASTWSAPAKGARFNIMTGAGRKRAFEHRRINHYGWLYLDSIKALDKTLVEA